MRIEENCCRNLLKITEMGPTFKMKLIYLFFIMFDYIYVETRANRESSGEYLQKVMFQLQEFNVPSPINVYDRLSLKNNNKNVPTYGNRNGQSHTNQRINMNVRQNVGKYGNQSVPHYSGSANEKVDLHRTDFESFPHYYQTFQPQTSIITKVREPEVLGFTRAELAAMYKNALEKGSSVSLSSLTDALSSGGVPQVGQTHVEFPVKQPLYQYYFFPLKSFMSEFRKDHGYKTISAPSFDNTEAAQVTQTQLSHPLFAAISTFITMAIVFMMSVLFLPKLTQLDIFQARGIQDDFIYLSNIVRNAIERYDFLEKFNNHRVDTVM